MPDAVSMPNLPLSVPDGPARAHRLCWCNPAVWWLTSQVQHARAEVVDHLTVLAIGSRRRESCA